jgi:hypothetical protein
MMNTNMNSIDRVAPEGSWVERRADRAILVEKRFATKPGDAALPGDIFRRFARSAAVFTKARWSYLQKLSLAGLVPASAVSFSAF